jgi:spermidine/putrescine transport system substrate-binding protein
MADHRMTDEELFRRWETGKVSRRGVLAGAAAAAFLAACAKEINPSGSPRGNGSSPTVSDQLEAELSVYNWAEYVEPKAYSRFSKEFDVKITEDVYPSNEDALAKLQAGAKGYDLVVPTGYMVQVMIEQGLLSELDHSKIPNLAIVDPLFLDTPFDPGNRFSVPKDFGTTGICWRSELVSEDITGWEDFYRLAPKYSGRYTVLDSAPEVVGSALKLLGYSYNSTDAKEIDEATQELIKLKPHVRKITSSMREILSSGEAYMSLTWNGEAGYVAAKAKDARYVVPKEGTELWTDNWCVVNDAPHPAAAHAFINWHLEPEQQARDTAYHFYGGVVDGEEEFLDPKIANDPAVYPAPETLTNLEFAEANPDWLRLRNDAWTKFKAA